MGVLVATEPDLFGWRALAELRRLRGDLVKRIACLPVHSHRRVVLQVRLQTLVVEILKLEQQGSGRQAERRHAKQAGKSPSKQTDWSET